MKKICIFVLSTLALAWFPVSEIAIVSMVSMLFHGISVGFYGIQVEFHGIPWNAMDVILFLWHFSGILWYPGGMPWNAMEVTLFSWHFSER